MTEQEARQQFQQNIQAEKQRATQEFESSLAQAQAAERQKFQNMVAANILASKRQMALSGQYKTPTEFLTRVQSWKAEQSERLEKDLRTYAESEREKAKAKLAEWEKSEAQRFEQSVSAAKVQEQIQTTQPKSIAETLIGWQAPIPQQLLGIDIELFRIPTKEGVMRVGFAPFRGYKAAMEATAEAGAGFVAPVESVVYSVGALAGAKGLPRPPPSLISSVIGLPFGGAEWQQLTTKPKYPFTYAASSLGMDIILSYVGGKILEASPVGKAIGKVETAITKPVKAAWRGSDVELWLIRHSDWYAERAAKGLAPQIVSIPRLPEVIGSEALGMEPALKASWELAATPKTSGILWTPSQFAELAAPEVAKKATVFMPTLTARAGAVSIGYMYPSGEERVTTSLQKFITSTKASSSAIQILTTPKELPKLFTSIFGSEAVTPRGATGLSAAIFTGLKIGAALVAKPMVAPVVSEKAISVQVARMKLAPAQAARTIQRQALSSIIFQRPAQLKAYAPSRRFEEELRRRATKRMTPMQQAIYGKTEYKFPVMGVKGAAQYVFGKR